MPKMPCIVRKIVVIYIYMDILMTYLNQSQEDKRWDSQLQIMLLFLPAQDRQYRNWKL